MKEDYNLDDKTKEALMKKESKKGDKKPEDSTFASSSDGEGDKKTE